MNEPNFKSRRLIRRDGGVLSIGAGAAARTIPALVAMIALAASSAAWPVPAAAQGISACFRIVNVRSDDVLNLRAAPHHRAPILARFSPLGRVILGRAGPCGGWCFVTTSTGQGTLTGWVNSRYLARVSCP